MRGKSKNLSLLGLWGVTIVLASCPALAHAKQEKEPPANRYFREDLERRQRWAKEDKEAKERGQPKCKENRYFKEDREKRERWEQEKKS